MCTCAGTIDCVLYPKRDHFDHFPGNIYEHASALLNSRLSSRWQSAVVGYEQFSNLQQKRTKKRQGNKSGIKRERQEVKSTETGRKSDEVWGVGRHLECTARLSSPLLMKDSSTKTSPPPPPTTADLAEEAMDGQGIDPKMTVMGGGEKEKAADYANCECCRIPSMRVLPLLQQTVEQHNPRFVYE